jgi:hypothetical protein
MVGFILLQFVRNQHMFRIRHAQNEENKDRAKAPPRTPLPNSATLNIRLGDELSESDDSGENESDGDIECKFPIFRI